MLGTKMMPLRNTVGKPIAIESAEIVDVAAGLTNQNTYSKSWSTMGTDFLKDDVYAEFLPDHVELSAERYRPGPGVAVMNRPADLPFEASAPFSSLWSLGKEADNEELSRELWVKFRLNLRFGGESPLVGGICYGGYPYLPYYITPQGEISSNFGLPREIRVSWVGQHGEGFLDDETSLTQQESASHSGVHIFPTGPIKTDHLILRLSDFPRIITDFSRGQVVERWGFIIPYIFVFAYKEQTRYQAHVPAGLLGAVHTWATKSAPSPIPTGSPRRRRSRQPNPFSHYYFERQLTNGTDDEKLKYAYGSADYIFAKDSYYFPSGGASIFQDASSRRHYELDRSTAFGEFFGSNRLAKDDELYFFIEQSEEWSRCLAGLRIAFRSKNLTGDTYLNPGIDVKMRVYEVDPPEGVSPLALDEPPGQNKYTTLIATQEQLETNDIIRQVKFVRPSSSRYFVIVFQALEAGHIFIDSLELVQSVHVAVTPRASRRQYINAMHFRLIGPELAEDYARLGSDGFSFSVEHLIAGQTKNVLFSANSLLDLLQTGAVRLYSNHRRRMVEKETSVTQDGSYSMQQTATRADGWKCSQTGNVQDEIDYDKIPIPGLDLKPRGEHGYTVMGNQETRNHIQHVIARTDPEKPEPFDLIGQFLALLDTFYPEFKDHWASNNEKLWKGDGGTWDPWKNVDIDELKVSGVWNINAAPGFQGAIEYSNALIDLVVTSITASATLPAVIQEFVIQYFDPNFYKALLATNGLGGSIGAGMGVSGSISANLGLPSMVNSAAVGSSGKITLQGSQTNYSYAQYLDSRFDQLFTRTEHPEGKMIREVRREVAGKDTERIKGAQVMWQEQLVDIVTGTIPLNVALPATAGNIYRTTDEVLRVRLGGGFRDSVSVDVWFDVREEIIRDDY